MKADIFYKVANNAGNVIHLIGYTLEQIVEAGLVIAESTDPNVDDNSVIITNIP